MRSGIDTHNRDLIERLHREAKGPFTASEAAGMLALPVPRVRRLLCYFQARGWLSRVRQGLYTPVPLGAGEPSRWREDPWVAVAKTFAPCYIGGWSACEHWSLTEQLFRDVVVVTARATRGRHARIQDTAFRLKHLPVKKHFGTQAVWRNQVRVQVSDPTRTVMDVLDDPSLGGGIRHVAEVLAAYWGSTHRDEARLIDYAERLGNRTVFKRLGYLLETLQIPAGSLIKACGAKQSRGLSRLDPAVPGKGRILKRWNLRVNVPLSKPGIPS